MPYSNARCARSDGSYRHPSHTHKCRNPIHERTHASTQTVTNNPPPRDRDNAACGARVFPSNLGRVAKLCLGQLNILIEARKADRHQKVSATARRLHDTTLCSTPSLPVAFGRSQAKLRQRAELRRSRPELGRASPNRSMSTRIRIRPTPAPDAVAQVSTQLPNSARDGRSRQGPRSNAGWHSHDGAGPHLHDLGPDFGRPRSSSAQNVADVGQHLVSVGPKASRIRPINVCPTSPQAVVGLGPS